MVGARLSVMMFLQFFVWGAWYVSMTGWIGANGLSDLIGWAYTVGPIAAVISPFFLGMVADRFFPTQRMLGAMHLVGGAILLVLPWRYRALVRRGKLKTVAVTAVARELAGFIWAVSRAITTARAVAK